MATHVWIAQGPEIGSCQMQDSLKIAWVDIFLKKNCDSKRSGVQTADKWSLSKDFEK